MLLVGTCVVVGLIIVFMAVGISGDHVSMSEVLGSAVDNVKNAGDLDK